MKTDPTNPKKKKKVVKSDTIPTKNYMLNTVHIPNNYEYRKDTTIAGNNKRRANYFRLLGKHGIHPNSLVTKTDSNGTTKTSASRVIGWQPDNPELGGNRGGGRKREIYAGLKRTKSGAYYINPVYDENDNKVLSKGFLEYPLPDKPKPKPKIKPRKKVKPVNFASTKGIKNYKTEFENINPQRLFEEDNFDVTTYSKNAMRGEDSLRQTIHSKKDLEELQRKNKNLNKRTVINNTNYKRKLAEGGVITDPTDPTNPKGKKVVKKSTTASRNKLKRQAYMKYADSIGLDTNDVVTKGNTIKLREINSTNKYNKRRRKIETRSHYRGKKGRVHRLPYMSPTNRVISRGVKLEQEKAVPKAALGAFLGTVGSFANSLIEGNKQEKLLEEQQKKEYNRFLGNEMQSDRFELEQSKKNTSYKPSVYAYGGKFKAKGGKLDKLSNNTVIAKGNKHDEKTIDNTSGIKLYRGGNAVAEIEDGEVVKNNSMVYSDRLKADSNNTYAEKAEKLSKEKNSTKSYKKKVILDKKENQLFQQQEASKIGSKRSKGYSSMGYKKDGGFLSGFDFKKAGKALTPFIDNIGNAVLTSKTPKLPSPILERVKNRKTTVNANPQLKAVRDASASTNRFIKNNTSNSNVARANLASNNLRKAGQVSTILANKENTETNLYNQNQAQVQATNARNLAKINQHNMNQVARADDIHGRVSKNISNLTGDLVDGINRDNKEKMENRRLDIVERMYNTGTTNRDLLKDESAIARMKENPEKYADRFIGTTEEDMFKKLIRSKARPLNLNIN